jgi:transposase-like protein
MPRPISERKRAQIVADLRKPKAKLARIARVHGISPSSVKAIRAAAGLNPLPTPEAKARAAVARDSMMVEARRRRAVLELRALDEAEKFLDALHQPARVFAFGRNGDGEHAYVDQEVSEPTFKDKQALMISFGIATDKAMQLERYDQESSSGAKAAIMDLVDRMTAAEGAEETPVA